MFSKVELLDQSGNILYDSEPAAVNPDVPTQPQIPKTEELFNSYFDELYKIIHEQYFSPEGGPYHSLEKHNLEATDYGHMSTSEAYSYLVYLESLKSIKDGSLATLLDAFKTIEKHIVPARAHQPTAAAYNPSKPASYADEYDSLDQYPTEIKHDIPVGTDPLYSELKNTYGNSEVYAMHWLLDLDNINKFGNFADGVSKPSYVNSFQRGRMEGTSRTITHPSWEEFKWGEKNNGGFLPIFVKEKSGTYQKQWRYTSAPDAEARLIQSIARMIKFSDKLKDTTIMSKTIKFADYLRMSFYDKYFKPIGAQNLTAAGNGNNAKHNLISWYTAWGGSIDTINPWAWRLGCSHIHFGYQNPMAAWAATLPEFASKSRTYAQDWQTSLTRQIEFYQWLQSVEGAIAGGATNSYKGRYEAYPAGASTFYGLIYDPHPVFGEPDSNLWAGWQYWSMQRVVEYYYCTKDARVRKLIDKWIGWVLSNSTITQSQIEFPILLEWSGAPNNWTAGGAGHVNTDLHSTVTKKGYDVGLTASLAKSLMFYGAALAENSYMDKAKILLEYLWKNHKTAAGIAVESEVDFSLINNSLHIPDDYKGMTATGRAIDSSSTFKSIRPFYDDRPATKDMIAYHRFWEQVELATAFYEYSLLKKNIQPAPTPVPTPTPEPTPVPVEPFSISFRGNLTIDAAPKNGTLTIKISDKKIIYNGKQADTFAFSDDDGKHDVNVPKQSVPTPTPVPTPTGNKSLVITTIDQNIWAEGYVNKYTITNNTDKDVTWKIKIPNARLTSFWNIKHVGDNIYTGAQHNSVLKPGAKTEFGVQGQKSATESGNITITVV